MSQPIKNAERMQGLHPKLVMVLTRAAQICSVPIMIVQGRRTDEECYVNYGKGRNGSQCVAGGCPAKYAQPTQSKVTWLKKALSSNHRAQADGFGHAVDVSPVPYQPVVTPEYTTIANAMKAAAKELGIKIVWGGDWISSKDMPHFELA